MRIVVAPDSFKGSLTAKEVAGQIAVGIHRVWPQAEIITVPMADGGEGTVQSLVDATDGHIVNVTVRGPLGEPVTAFYGLLGDGKTAVIEMAAASGLPLIPPAKRNPRITTTWGTGELLLAAAKAGCERVIMGIGGSATNDGGAGMAQAIGVTVKDSQGKQLPPGGAALANLAKIECTGLNKAVAAMHITVACDVTNPLCGPQGASAVYAPQKGADASMVCELDAALAHYARIIKQQLHKDVANIPGAGAAGGLGAGLLAFLHAELKSGVEIVMEAVQLAEKIAQADIVITGEGGIDSQTAYGKAPAGVASLAARYGKPLITIAGSIADSANALHECGFGPLFSIVKSPMDLAQAIQQAPRLVADAAEEVTRCLQVGLQLQAGGEE